METTTKAMSIIPKQFDFGRHWRRKIVPHLDNPGVTFALMIGLKLFNPQYVPGDPPWECGRGPFNGQRARRGCLSWYQPWGGCHYIAPFCWALGRKLFPRHEWGFITCDLHTVVIGWTDDWQRPEWVMDIVLFKEKTAEESLAFAKSNDWKFYRSFAEYVASFVTTDPELALAAFRDLPIDALLDGPNGATAQPEEVVTEA